MADLGLSQLQSYPGPCAIVCFFESPNAKHTGFFGNATETRLGFLKPMLWLRFDSALAASANVTVSQVTTRVVSGPAGQLTLSTVVKCPHWSFYNLLHIICCPVRVSFTTNNDCVQITFGVASTDSASQTYSDTLTAEDVMSVLGSDPAFIVSSSTKQHA